MALRRIALALALALLPELARADYNRQVGIVDLPDPAFTTGQLLRSSSADDAVFSGGADDRVMMGNGVTWLDVAVPTCDATAGLVLRYDTGTNTFGCATVTASPPPQPSTQVLFGTGTGITSSSHLKFDDATNELQVGDTTTLGTIQFPMGASSAGYAQVQGRGGGSYVRFYPNRNVTLAADDIFLGVDSQNDSAFNAVYIGANNNDAMAANLRFGFREDGSVLFYSPDNAGTTVRLTTPTLGIFQQQTYTWPQAMPAVDRYCLGSTTAGVWSWVDCALLGGRAGGQTLYGGTATGEKLILGGNAIDSPRQGLSYIGVLHELRMWPNNFTAPAGNYSHLVWQSTATVNDLAVFPKVIWANGTWNFNNQFFAGLPPVYFYYQATINANTTTGLSGVPIYVNQGVYNVGTGATTTLDAEGASSFGHWEERPTYTRTGTGAYDASANVVSHRMLGSVAGGTINRWTQVLMREIGGAGTLNQQRGLVVENKTKCTAPNCVGISNASTTDYPGATQNLNATGEITGCKTRTSAYITQGSAGATLRINTAPTLADGRDGQICRITNVDTAGNTAFSVEDETVTAGTNLRVSLAASCNLCVAAMCTLNTRDFVEFTYNGVLGDWIMTGCANN